jgi:ATP-dependent Clp protease ATP-binding subunit ClpA
VAPLILDTMLANVAERLSVTQNLKLELTPEVRSDLLRRVCERLEFGGRGIGNIVEKVLVNPLARYVFDNDVKGPGMLTVDSIADSPDGQIVLTCRTEPAG